MESECWMAWRGALEREALRSLTIGEAYAVLLLEKLPVCAADGDILGAPQPKSRILAGLNKSQASKGKTTIPYLMAVIELRPGCADKVEFQERRIPLTGIEDEAVPLDNEAVGRSNMIRQVADHELGILP